MRLRWAGDHRTLRGKTALDCMRHHCHGDHSAAAQRGDIDGVMKRLAETFKLDLAYAAQPTLDERCEVFVKIALQAGLMVEGAVAQDLIAEAEMVERVRTSKKEG